MSGLSNTPRLTKGAIVGFDVFNPLASVTVFQYNPNELTRTLSARSTGGGGAKAEPLRLTGAPKETIKINVEIDATDQLEAGSTVAASMGIYPQLSALEMLIYPKTLKVMMDSILMRMGTIEIAPPEAPLTLFVWGTRRVLPVRINGFTITEKAYDADLNPLRATVMLDMQVLSYSDLSVTHPGYHLFLGHQMVKEAMAVVGSVGSMSGG